MKLSVDLQNEPAWFSLYLWPLFLPHTVFTLPSSSCCPSLPPRRYLSPPGEQYRQPELCPPTPQRVQSARWVLTEQTGCRGHCFNTHYRDRCWQLGCLCIPPSFPLSPSLSASALEVCTWGSAPIRTRWRSGILTRTVMKMVEFVVPFGGGGGATCFHFRHRAMCHVWRQTSSPHFVRLIGFVSWCIFEMFSPQCDLSPACDCIVFWETMLKSPSNWRKRNNYTKSCRDERYCIAFCWDIQAIE